MQRRQIATTTASMAILVLAGRAGGQALNFDGQDDRVRMGPASGLNLAEFTVECWFRRLGPGETVSTGSGGLTGDDEAVPLVTKGRGESDGDELDMNYFLGLHGATWRLAADFEEHASGGDPGQNHPVLGITPVVDDTWHHAAVTYDGSCWELYLDGCVETSGPECPGAPPNFDSIQPFAVATAIRSTGVAKGHFEGDIDEVRVWDRALTGEEILANLNLQIETAPGLVGRWSLDEAAGQVAGDSAGLHDGHLGDEPAVDPSDPVWVGGAPFDLTLPPDVPTLVAPADGAAGIGLTPVLEVLVTDPDLDPMSVTFHQGVPASNDPFTIVVLPDTQKYVCFCNGGSPDFFEAQTQWTVDVLDERNVVFLTQLGDCVQHGDDAEEWDFADAAMSLIEDPVTTQLVDGIPFGIAVGNHDQEPAGDPDGSSTFLYNQYFGEQRFAGRAYYGGHHGNNNDNHFQLFSASGMDFIVVHIEFDEDANGAVLAWADALLAANADRRAIVVSHYLMELDGDFSSQGQATYDALKGNPNLFLMLCGHKSAEEHRSDTYQGNTVHSLLSDYQSRDNGGDGWLRILEFSPADDEIRVRTYSPVLDEFETDDDSEFTISYEMDAGTSSVELGTVTDVASGDAASLAWPDLDPQATYEWFVTVEDGSGATITGPSWTFTTTACAGGTGGDVTGDQVVNVDDLLVVIEWWGACPENCPATCCDGDADGTCVVDIFDLMEVILNWN